MVRRLSALVMVLAALTGASLLVAPDALAHAELVQTSPAPTSTVGGSFHQVVMLFTELDPEAEQNAEIYDPAGNLLDTTVISEDQKLVLPIEPLEVPGVYVVRFGVIGVDGDYSEQQWSFRFDPAADPPAGLTALADGGFDIITFALVLVGAAIAAFLVHRVRTAWNDHRAAQLIEQ